MSDTDLETHHVGITVDDLESTLAFYRDALGFSVADRFEVAGEAFAEAVGVEGASARFVHLDGRGIRLELVTYDPEARSVPTGGLNQPGATHVGFAVDDLESFVAALPAAVERLSDPRTTATGTTICFLRDPEGNLVEVLES